MTKTVDTQYEALTQYVLDKGTKKTDRTGTGTISYFSPPELRYDQSNGFPLITTKKVHTKSIIHELLWFIKGDTNIKYLKDNGVRIWDEWADENGDLGPVYGQQWRAWPTYNGETVDQLQQVIDQIKTNPDSRRLIVNAWNVALVPEMALPPCHFTFQFYVADGKLSLKLTQRSLDILLGCPFNIASYALLLHMVAQQTDLEPGDFILSAGDAHIYDNHREQVELQLSRVQDAYVFPDIKINKRDSIDDYVFEDFEIIGYESHPAIKAPVAV